MDFQRAIEAYADATGGENPFDDRGYSLPTRWTAYHVAKRLFDAYGVVEQITQTPGPRAFGTAWPAMLREWQDLIDADAWKNHGDEYRAGVSRRRGRPEPVEIDMADEAVRWPGLHLRCDDPRHDALTLWVLASVKGFNVSKALARRRKQADAMIAALAPHMGRSKAEVAHPERLDALVRGVVATANVMLEQAQAAAKAARSDRALAAASQDALFARRHARERLAKMARVEKLLVRPSGARIARSDVMPGKVFSQSAYDEHRKAGAQRVADRLQVLGVAVR